MKFKTLTALIFATLVIPTASVQASPVYGGDIVTEYTKISDVPAILEETVRLRFDDQLSDHFYVHARAQAHAINNKAYDSIDQSVFDQKYVGYKTAGIDMRAGKQPLYLGKGLLADLNVSGFQATATAGDIRLLGFYSNDVQAADFAVSHKGLSFGATYKRQGDSTLGVNFAASFPGKAILSGEYVKNTSNNKRGYIAQIALGQYSLSYRDIENAAIDPDWATNYHYANSRGFRLRADYKIGTSSIFTVYQDIAKGNDNTPQQNITYAGYAIYL